MVQSCLFTLQCGEPKAAYSAYTINGEQVINSKQWANQRNQFSSHNCSSAAAPLLVRCVQQWKDLRKIWRESMSEICEGLSLSVTMSMVAGHYNHYLYILVPHILGVNIFFEHTSIKITCRSLSDTPVEKGKACFWSHSLAVYMRVFRTGKCYFIYLYTRWFTCSLIFICSSKQLKSAVHHVESMFLWREHRSRINFSSSFIHFSLKPWLDVFHTSFKLRTSAPRCRSYTHKHCHFISTLVITMC